MGLLGWPSPCAWCSCRGGYLERLRLRASLAATWRFFARFPFEFCAFSFLSVYLLLFQALDVAILRLPVAIPANVGGSVALVVSVLDALSPCTR